MTDSLTQATVAGADTGEFDGLLTCTEVRKDTHDVKTFVLAPEQGRLPPFRPGQYLTLTVDVDGRTLQRCYSLSCPPTRSAMVSITVKRVTGGPVSNWLHDHLAPGGGVWAAGPFGEFGVAQHPAGKHLYLSAGSGITPLMSMARTLHEGHVTADVVFLHSARTPEDIIFRSELEEMAHTGEIRVTTICEADSPSEHWPGPSGRLDLRTLLRAAPDLHDREIFTCGPGGYMASVREMLHLAGVDPARCHEESFDLAARAASPEAIDEPTVPGAQPYAVEFRRTGRSVDCAPGETVLHAARRAGLDPPSMCTEGMCGTCKTTLLAGAVDMRHAGGIRQHEADRGRILVCCSTPLKDLVVDA